MENGEGRREVLDIKAVAIVRKSAEVDSFMSILKKVEAPYPDDRILMLMNNGRVYHAGKVTDFWQTGTNETIISSSVLS